MLTLWSKNHSVLAQMPEKWYCVAVLAMIIWSLLYKGTFLPERQQANSIIRLF